MPKTAFPLTHNSSFRPGSDWHWWLVEFDAKGQRCRVLVMLHERKMAYRAWLGIEHPKGIAVMARLEHDPIHAGEWHCHSCCEDSGAVPLGVVRHPRSSRSLRLGMGRHRTGFGVTESTALPIALKFFGIDASPGAGGLFDVEG